mmetsp:Transcript_5516/g.16660  ORF Transcript_5516/g.16660 Transcript_5516/m.16660 type:complete len:380 (+) Transcript_5516:42-1181(+)|eukprot:CAMPEP_0182930068 /NCGR_PEP_ID=MMETSP0105_2-20130417/23726_1 /TAXON_ID=81532 ORGANISM="Acanthoeca-like sp., Strain 10tr" /NCGR_SAMPLE_ID=MMETSP0105_2 /ASSEMBLY_ACC=CAM_ASM_000205 /LENGTH=379 /DNA_ID=CAMNT_0025068291 /DNA_START=21 /DNA_END=1160 /DNA_ORIENTATION=+
MNTMITALATSLAIFGVANAGVCQDTNYPECVSMGCANVTQGNGCRQPASCTNGNNAPYIYYDGERTGVRVFRSPVSPAEAELCDSDNECSAIYTIYLDRKWTTADACNDLGMLPPMGRNQLKCAEMEADLETDAQMWNGVDLRDWTGHPFKNDGIKQSLAAAERSVTALTEPSTNCALSATDTERNQHCAFPLGFMTDTIIKNLGLCVNVVGAQDSWIEIMASSMEGSSGGSFCVRDRSSDPNEDGEKGCTVTGDLIDIRASSNRPLANTNTQQQLQQIFYAADNTDDAAIDIQWRITASYIRPTNLEEAGSPGEQKDAEDWSMSRDGAGYPMSLVAPYPANYNGTPVFETSTGSSASWTAPLAQLVLALVAMTLMLF